MQGGISIKIWEVTHARVLERQLLLAILLVLVLSEIHPLNLFIMKTSAVVSPYIGVVPASTVNQTLTPGMNYTISLYTDYTGDDVNGYGFELTYNPEVLEGLEVVNGDLITEDVAPIMFSSVGFDNTAGRLRYTYNAFFFMNEPAPTTTGPGTLANVTFRIIAKGTSNITLETEGGYRTRLIGYTEDGYGDYYNIIDSETMPDHIQHGSFDNRLPHDVAVVNVTAQAQATVDSLVSVNVEVANIGASVEVANVTICFDTNYIDSKNVTLLVGENSTVPFSWNTTGLTQGTYTVNATATISDDGDLSDNWNTTTFLVSHDVAVVSVTAPDKGTIGSVISISVEVANEGSLAEMANVTVFYDSTVIGFNDTVVIPAQNSAIVPFSWNTTGLTQGTYTVNATATISDDGDLSDNWNTTTIFLAEHDVAVVSVTAPAETTVGSVVSISVEVENVGKSDEDVEVTVSYDTTHIDSKNVTLLVGENSTVVFSWNTTGVAQGIYTLNATATISDDGDLSDNWGTTAIFIVEHDVVVKNVLVTPVTATPGDIMSINVTVANIGASVEVANVTIHYDTNYIDSQNVTLLVGENSTVVFSWNTTGVAQGIYTLNATATISDDGDLSDNWNTTTILLAMHDVAITYISVQPATVYVGDLATIIVQVANLGWYNETFQVEITYDTTTIEEPKSIAVLSGDSDYIQFSWNTTSVAPGSYTITAKAILGIDTNSTNNLMTKSIVINPPPPGAIAGTVTDASTGEPIVGASVTAEGYTAITDIQGRYNITDVPVGTFNVTVEATGYSSDFKLASVESQKTTTVNFTLRVISTISISADPTNITVGKSTTLSGSIDPIYQSVTVTIWYRLSGEGLWSNLATVTTNQDSQYSYVWTPETSGTYEIKASWLGDENTLPAESDLVVIIVEDTEAPEILPYAAAAALVAIILAIIVYYLLRIRKSK